VDRAINGLEALELVEENFKKTCCDKYYKLIFIDIKLPLMDGITATKRIFEVYNDLKSRGKQQLPRLTVVAVTAYTDKVTVQSCLKVGMVDVLQKPVSLDMVSSFVQKYLQPESR